MEIIINNRKGQGPERERENIYENKKCGIMYLN